MYFSYNDLQLAYLERVCICTRIAVLKHGSGY